MPLRLQEVEPARISRQSAYEGGKFVSSTNWPPLPLSHPGDTTGTHFRHRLSRARGHCAAGRVKLMKYFKAFFRESNPQLSGL
jgi:hypothetical protein